MPRDSTQSRAEASVERERRVASAPVHAGLADTRVDALPSFGPAQARSHTGVDAKSDSVTRPETSDARVDLPAPREPDESPTLESTFLREPHDVGRTAEVRSYLQRSAVAARLDPETVKEADCGADVCRVVLSFVHARDAIAFEQSARNPDFRFELRTPTVPREMPAPLGSLESGLDSPPLRDTTPSAEDSLPAFDPPAPESGPQPLLPGAEPAAQGALMELEILLASRQGGADVRPHTAAP